MHKCTCVLSLFALCRRATSSSLIAIIACVYMSQNSVYMPAMLGNRASLPRDQLNNHFSLTLCLSSTPLAAPVTKMHTIGSINNYSFYIQLHLCTLQYINVCRRIYERISFLSIYIHIHICQYTYVQSNIRYCCTLASGSTKKTHSSIYIPNINTSAPTCNQINPCICIPTGHHPRPGNA